jgi:hypothetical protein
MSSRLSPALAEFAEGRWPDEWNAATRRRHPRELDLPQLDTVDLDPRDVDPRYLDPRGLDPRSMEPPLHPNELDQLERKPRNGLGRWVPVALVRFIAIFFIGVGATMAWQTYAGATGRTVSGLLSGIGLGFLAPPLAAPAAATEYPADQLAALSRSLATVRESVDKLAADIAKLQAAKQDPQVRTSALPTPGRKPAQRQ